MHSLYSTPTRRSSALHAAVEGDRQRLRPAHAAAAPGQGQGAAQSAAEPLLGHCGERLIGALQDALGTDVDPGPGGHLDRKSTRLNSSHVAITYAVICF